MNKHLVLSGILIVIAQVTLAATIPPADDISKLTCSANGTDIIYIE